MMCRVLDDETRNLKYLLRNENKFIEEGKLRRIEKRKVEELGEEVKRERE